MCQSVAPEGDNSRGRVGRGGGGGALRVMPLILLPNMMTLMGDKMDFTYMISACLLATIDVPNMREWF